MPRPKWLAKRHTGLKHEAWRVRERTRDLVTITELASASSLGGKASNLVLRSQCLFFELVKNGTGRVRLLRQAQC
jgi:hypothetical protein